MFYIISILLLLFIFEFIKISFIFKQEKLVEPKEKSIIKYNYGPDDLFSPEIIAKISEEGLKNKIKKEEAENLKRLNALEIKANELVSSRIGFIKDAIKTAASRGEYSVNITSFLSNIPEELKEKSITIIDKISTYFTKKTFLLNSATSPFHRSDINEYDVEPRFRKINLNNVDYYLSWEHFKPDQKPVEELNSYRG